MFEASFSSLSKARLLLSIHSRSSCVFRGPAYPFGGQLCQASVCCWFMTKRRCTLPAESPKVDCTVSARPAASQVCALRWLFICSRSLTPGNVARSACGLRAGDSSTTSFAPQRTFELQPHKLTLPIGYQRIASSKYGRCLALDSPERAKTQCR